MEDLLEDVVKVRERASALGHKEGVDPNWIFSKLESLIGEESSVRVGKVVSLITKLKSPTTLKSNVKASIKNGAEFKPDESVGKGEGMSSLTGSQGAKVEAANEMHKQTDVEQASVGLMATGELLSITTNVDEANQNNEAIHILEQGLRRDTDIVMKFLADMNGRKRDYDEVYAYLEANLKKKNRVDIVVDELLVVEKNGEESKSLSPQLSKSPATIRDKFKGKGKARMNVKGKAKKRDSSIEIIDVDAEGKAKTMDDSPASKKLKFELLASDQEGSQSRLTPNKIVHQSTPLPPTAPLAVAVKKPPSPTTTNAATVNQPTEVLDNKSSTANFADVASLVKDLIAMFPSTPPDYIQSRCRDIVGKTAAISRLTEELLESPHPPEDWIMFHKPVKTVQDTAPAGVKLQDGHLGGYVDVDKSPVAGPSSRLNKLDVDHKSSYEERYDDNDPVEKKVFTPAELRTIKEDDPSFKIAWDAVSYFYSMQLQSGSFKRMEIKSVTVSTNRKLAKAFEAKKKYFVEKKIPANPIYAYHGTQSDPAVLDSIIDNNFDMKYAKRQVHGAGHYFSEFPDVSLGYGPGLIFCQLLSGKEYKGSELTWPGFDSKVVEPSPGTGHSRMVIIQDSDQILPLCIIHLKKRKTYLPILSL